jgi:large subunit ribosomal protein L29
MKSEEFRKLTMDELKEKLVESQKNLQQLRFKATMKELDRTSDIRAMRRDVARIHQIIGEKERASAPAVQVK